MICSAYMEREINMDSKQSNKSFGIALMGALLLLMFLIYYFSLAHQNEEQTVVKSQLQAIQEGRLTEAYYVFTSKEFQTATSLEHFKKFTKNFPLFRETYALKFEQDDKPGQIRALLIGEGKQLKLLFNLTKEDKDWHVKNIEIVKEGIADSDLPQFDARILKEPIEQFMQLLKQGEIEKAYQGYTAEPFQESTTLDAFKAFLKEFPVFSDYEKLDFQKLTFNNNLGTYTLKLTSKSGSKYDMKFDLIKEDGAWKILQIQIEGE